MLTSTVNTKLTKEEPESEIRTGLPNIFAFRRRVNSMIESGEIIDYCGCYFDIARMSLINARYGKKNGDIVIKKYVEVIKRFLNQDEIMARLGCDHFACLIKQKRLDRFLQLLQDIPVTLDSDGCRDTIHVTSIAGIYKITSASIASDDILAKVTKAASYAKNVAHKPYVIMDAELEETIHEDQLIEEEIMWGLRHREFVPFYQPKVDTRTETLIGAEALARWKHDGSYVSPAVFIPPMEKNGLICELDFYMLDCVCRDIREWIDSGYEPVEVSVNLSRRNLSDPKLAGRISNVLNKYSIPHNLIQIEITETLSEHSLHHVGELVDNLHLRGISTAIDDFGSGSSSITLLKYANFKDLKIDKSFIDYASDMEKQLLSDIVRMAKNMKMNVIAEGVENENQVRELNEMGCFKIQGYFFDKPIPKENFEIDWLRKSCNAQTNEQTALLLNN